MAGRSDISFQDILNENVTYLIDGATITYDATKERGSAQVDLAVMISANKTVALTSDNAAVEGKLIKVERDGKCTVEVAGYLTLPGGNGATLTPNGAVVGALGPASARGYIKTADPAQLAQVAAGRGRIVDATDPTKTVVRFL